MGDGELSKTPEPTGTKIRHNNHYARERTHENEFWYKSID